MSIGNVISHALKTEPKRVKIWKKMTVTRAKLGRAWRIFMTTADHGLQGDMALDALDQVQAELEEEIFRLRERLGRLHDAYVALDEEEG